jgi:UrcA family protein
MNNRLIAIAAASFVALMSTTVQADTIELSEFDLTTAAGNEALYNRIVSTAGQLCRPALGGVSSDMRAYRRCVDEVVESAVEKSRLPSLYGYHAAKTGQINGFAAAD